MLKMKYLDCDFSIAYDDVDGIVFECFFDIAFEYLTDLI